MDRIENRLQEAAAETRRAAEQASPPPLPVPQRGAAGWLVLASAFAAVLLVFALPLLLGRQAAPLGGGPESTVSPLTTLGPANTTTRIDDTPQQCSATGVPIPEYSPVLPAEVAARADAIIAVASDCDFEGLAANAAPGFITSFGGGGIDHLADLEADGRGELDILLRLFDTRHEILEIPDGPDIYVWPAAFAYDTWEEIPEADRTELLEIYTEGELDQIAGFGSYAGWRIGIDETGEWLFFIAGD